MGRQYEPSLHVTRLIVGGVLDRIPGLKIIVGLSWKVFRRGPPARAVPRVAVNRVRSHRQYLVIP